MVTFPFFYDSSLQGYGAWIYIQSQNKVKILTSSPEIMGKSVFSAPQSEISSAVLAIKMEQKVKHELYTVNLKPSVFIVNSGIVLKMIAKNDPADLPIFYGTRVMGISALTKADNWFRCLGTLNPAYLLTKTGSSLENISSGF